MLHVMQLEASGDKTTSNPGMANLSDECRVLADVAEPPNMKQAFDAGLAVVLLQSQLGALESKTGLPMMNYDKTGKAQNVTITGWTALAGIASLIVLMLFGANYAWRRYKGSHETAGYTLVVKNKPGRS